MAAVRVASVLCWISGIGFGLPCIPAIRNLLTGQGVPMIMGFPAYGGGYFESLGVRPSVPLVGAFLAVCIGECISGWLLWGGNRGGAILAIVLLPPGAIFWFSLPFGPLLAIVRTVLLMGCWRSLR